MRVDVVHLERLEKTKQHHAEHAAPYRARTIVVFASDDGIAYAAFGPIVIHGDVGVVHKNAQPIPVILHAFQRLACGGFESFTGQLLIAQPRHGIHLFT